MTHILALVILWIELLWTGLFLILMSDPFSVLHAPSGTQASIANKFYFSGYVLSTLGNGQYIPNGEGWQIVVAAFSFAGFIFITTAMTYLMNLTSAVIHKRNLSLFISNMGETPEDILKNTYSADGFKRLTDVVPPLQQMINKHNQNHYAHPGVHYFYSIPRSESLSVNLANLDETLTILLYHIKREESVAQDLRPLRDAINKFLNMIRRHFIQTFEFEEEYSVNLQHLYDYGIPLKERTDDKPIAKKRKTLLAGLLRSTAGAGMIFTPSKVINRFFKSFVLINQDRIMISIYLITLKLNKT